MEACDEIVPLLKKISDAMERDIYIQKISRRMNLREEHIRSRMENISTKRGFSDIEKKRTETASASNKNAELLVLQLMLCHPKIINLVDKASFIEELTDSDIKQICSMILTEYQKKGSFSLSALIEKAEKENLRKIIAENSFENHLAGEPRKIMEDCIRDIRLKKNIKEQEKIRRLLKQAEAIKDEKLSIKYLEESQKLLKEKKKILRLEINT
jgi:DNA primase